ncbi:hypothetical protein HAZT_HAZT010172 [Hyalella azteca]|uniref:Ubiquinone biosynthesis protein n=1 Tax=Hyalella azteca TaxID=294128 RepID=A0A6A0H1T2_HYAAZ|nr:hypothetical protein HAZT_HAZT010172 [Hyalella azteca]
MSGQESYGSVSDVRAAVLDAALQHVPLLGWTEAAIAKGAEELGYSCAAHSLVEGGGAELFLWLQRRLNQQVEEHLEEFTLQGGEKRDVMLEALKQRLLLLMPYRAVYAQGLGTLATSPSLLGESISITASLADIVCHYSGSNQPDTSWYVDRASVAAVYKLTELCYLQDQSADCQVCSCQTSDCQVCCCQTSDCVVLLPDA